MKFGWSWYKSAPGVSSTFNPISNLLLLVTKRVHIYDDLISASKGERYIQMLNCDLEDEEKLKMLEKLGDVYSEAKSCEKALNCYQEQVGTRLLPTKYIHYWLIDEF